VGTTGSRRRTGPSPRARRALVGAAVPAHRRAPGPDDFRRPAAQTCSCAAPRAREL